MAESLARSVAKHGWLLLVVAALGAAGCSAKAVTCPEGQTACGETCVNLQTDPMHCGSCSVGCPVGGTCTAGSCACPATLPDRCGLSCVNLQADGANCGACGHACGLGTCAAGSCSCDPAPVALCPPPAAGTCVDTSSNASSCGGCGIACLSGEVCSSSSCVCNPPRQICAEGTTSVCADLQTNPRHCGTCTTACASGENCVAGTCQRTCAAGLTLCGDTCVNLQTDVAHCGSCANACLLGQVCSAGTCQSATCTTLQCGAGNTCCEAPQVGNSCCTGACPIQHRNFIGTASAMSYYNCDPSYLYRWTVEAAETAARAWAPNGNRISSAQSCVIAGASSLCLVWQKPFVAGLGDQGCAVFCYSDSLAGTATVSTTAACPCPTVQRVDWY